MKELTKEEKFDKFINTLGFFVQKYPPEGFSVPYFHMCVVSGRIEELTKYLEEFTPSRWCECGHREDAHTEKDQQCNGKGCECKGFIHKEATHEH